MLSMALHLRDQELSLRDLAAQLIITKGKKKGLHRIRNSRVVRGVAFGSASP